MFGKLGMGKLAIVMIAKPSYISKQHRPNDDGESSGVLVIHRRFTGKPPAAALPNNIGHLA
ncbi:hypothetical protein [Sphingobacterium griseoflavum]|uniref:hypothetical protein n=1 Tax=Sphingobacterium griseoflavum TaxID=1474952 RepID=UPI0016741CDD|nr:hypothetical protein [Sphingobacterium griseoflavum]